MLFLPDLAESKFNYLDEFNSHIMEKSDLNKIVTFKDVFVHRLNSPEIVTVFYDMITLEPNMLVTTFVENSFGKNAIALFRKNEPIVGFKAVDTNEDGKIIIAYIKNSFI